ncbi:MAG: hypothetical protein WBC13_03750, partial [Dokdonella sp.]
DQMIDELLLLTMDAEALRRSPILSWGRTTDGRLYFVEEMAQVINPTSKEWGPLTIQIAIDEYKRLREKNVSVENTPLWVEWQVRTDAELEQLQDLVNLQSKFGIPDFPFGSQGSSNIGKSPTKGFVLLDMGAYRTRDLSEQWVDLQKNFVEFVQTDPLFTIQSDQAPRQLEQGNINQSSAEPVNNANTQVSTGTRAFFSGLREGAGGWIHGNGVRRNTAFIAHRAIFYAPIPFVKGWIVLGTDLVHAGVWGVQKIWPPKASAPAVVTNTTGRQVVEGIMEVIWPELSTAQDWGRFIGSRLSLYPLVGDVGGFYVIAHDVALVARDLWVSAVQIFTDGNVSHGVVSIPNSREASGLSRWGTSRFMVTAFAAIPYPVKPIVMAVWDGGQYIWRAVNPTHYEETLARWGTNPVARGFIEVARLPVIGDVLSLHRYRAQRVFMLLPWWWNLGTFGLNDIVRITLVGFGVKQNEAVHASQEVLEKMTSVQKALVDRVLSRSTGFTRRRLMREPLEDVIKETYRLTPAQAQEIDKLYRANGGTHDAFFDALRAQSDE